MTRHRSMISLRLQSQTLIRITALTDDQRHALHAAYPAPTTRFPNRSAIFRALIECGLDSLNPQNYPRLMEHKPCPVSTAPPLKTLDAPASA